VQALSPIGAYKAQDTIAQVLHDNGRTEEAMRIMREKVLPNVESAEREKYQKTLGNMVYALGAAEQKKQAAEAGKQKVAPNKAEILGQWRIRQNMPEFYGWQEPNWTNWQSEVLKIADSGTYAFTLGHTGTRSMTARGFTFAMCKSEL